MWEYCFLSFNGLPLWRKGGPIHVWSLCWLYLCSIYRELNIVYTTHYIRGLTNLLREERYPLHATFTAIPICSIYLLPQQRQLFYTNREQREILTGCFISGASSWPWPVENFTLEKTNFMWFWPCVVVNMWK